MSFTIQPDHNRMPRSYARLLVALAFAAGLSLPAAPLRAQDQLRWPRAIVVNDDTVLIYQPQVDSFVKDQLTGRAAVSLSQSGKAAPVFGALWFNARVHTDRDAGLVDFSDIHVLKLRVPGFSDDEQQSLATGIEQQTSQMGLTDSLARFTATVAAARLAAANAKDLKSTPPKIIVSQEPAALVIYDGDPVLRPIEGSDYQHVVNTPFAVIFDPADRSFWLDGGQHWYTARAATGPWTYRADPPSAITNLVPPDSTAVAADSGPARKIIVATEPSELIVTTGTPQLTPLTGTDLLYVSNTESDVFVDIATQKYYVLLSGRWFRSRGMNGPWESVTPDNLPSGFRKIPADSPKASVLASVPGTDQAQDAMTDAAIPQTAAISRSSAHLDVTYDGDPDFQTVNGTDFEYAVNASTAVLRIHGLYYACDQGVWYVASEAAGPWAVSDSVPTDVQEIPPSNPLYNVTYAHVYESTPDVVYVGYTAGYLNAFIWDGALVYGTGWYYPPYFGPGYYWPRPWTWGFHYRYYPWRGWICGYRWDAGFFGIGVGWGGGYRYGYRPPGWYGGGWFGPAGFRGPWLASRPGRFAGPGFVGRARVTFNIYNRPEMRPMVVARPTTRNLARPAVGPGRRANNVFVTPDGQVKRRTANGWQTRNGNTWKPDAGGARTPKTTTRPAPDPNRDRLDRDYRGRTRPLTPTAPKQAPRATPRAAPPRAAPRSGGGGGGGARGRPHRKN